MYQTPAEKFADSVAAIGCFPFADVLLMGENSQPTSRMIAGNQAAQVRLSNARAVLWVELRFVSPP